MRDDHCDLLCIDFDHAEGLRAELPSDEVLAGRVARLRALSDTTRLRIGYALGAGGELCVCDLAWIVGSSQGLVSHHLRQLRSAGLVESRRDGKLVMYRLSAAGGHLLRVVSVGAAETDPV
ncbi:ArsR family transcriptional regulator [Tamaricihabitans halophyticus]|uniref:ArsR family transcriptional regulator n=1 Tax=Tamaricihabitans halophyticus TaxID=1262583 RepID=A0A4V2STA4_9PSEU|nr:metalloregulator ArsR/SmtB family transcription factor [Tamaricihabitans halophyticus]TCP49976.1 ArsR family transcriptional regulator [Tamaricihabitans halophyticus]